jgi:hypothetical protein
MKEPIRHFEANTEGRDFIIGDLHGSYSCFENLLKNIKFDETVDRMFSVGDLVDRGPDSKACLDLLLKPWFYCVIANHEQMMYEAFHGGYMGMFWMRNGGSWAHAELTNWQEYQRDKFAGVTIGAVQIEPSTQHMLDLLQIVNELPYLITIELQDGSKAHVMHAEPAPGVVPTDDMFSSPGKLMEIATFQTTDGDFMCWGRAKFRAFYDADLSNRKKIVRTVAYNYPGHEVNRKLSRIISGHTIVHKPLTILGQTDIDTCAFGSYPDGYGSRRKWAGLTCLELNEWKFVQATDTEFRHVSPLVVNTADIKALRAEESTSETDPGSSERRGPEQADGPAE